jgi:diacylglycerol kinase (ATP)
MKILFIINHESGGIKKDWPLIIGEYFKDSEHNIEQFHLPKDCSTKSIKEKILEFKPERVIAVGGDGTVKLVATCLLGSNLVLGILPAGSANGLAKELKIPEDANQAIDLVVAGEIQLIHMIRINDNYCIHLSDIGFNAFMVKKFEKDKGRGFWGYLKASWKAIRHNPVMQLEIKTDSGILNEAAEMVVLANATRYGTGALINPNGKLNDEFFEIIIVRKISFSEIFKMIVSHMPYDTKKTEVLQISSVKIHAKRSVHFQVDGEYLNKVCDIHAAIIPRALYVIGSIDPINALK